jgi:hypothetical protein
MIMISHFVWGVAEAARGIEDHVAWHAAGWNAEALREALRESLPAHRMGYVPSEIEQAAAASTGWFMGCPHYGADQPPPAPVVSSWFVQAAARARFCLDWADAVEEHAVDVSLSGCRLEDVAPPTPRQYELETWAFLGGVEYLNVGGLEGLLRCAILSDGLEDWDEGYVASMGHCLMLEALGHGVGWADDHAPIPHRTPSWIEHEGPPMEPRELVALSGFEYRGEDGEDD